ncbi:MAG TPA: c-type cytochrome [Caldithrix abyssi]|uniref:C-type cytochrome n=1 Tax=Caldithrix abyssi TaxID=187145 RepID=A0A7V4WWM6_CALAY|nr:c-type cytochrome [Caldithrix abyssi]
MKNGKIWLVYTVTALFITLLITLVQASDGQGAMSGKELFKLNCAGCHGQNLQGNPPVYPSLQDVSKRLSRSAVHNQIQQGKNLMPPFAHLSEEQREAIIDYLFSGTSKSVKAVTGAEKGEMLVRGNCLSCHRINPDDPRPTEARGMEPAHLSGAAQRFSYARFVNIIDRGPCYMPSFSHLSETDKESIYAYLETLKDEGTQVNRRSGRWGWHGQGRCGSGRCGGCRR